MLGTRLRARHLGRYKELVSLFLRYGRSDLVSKLEAVDEAGAESAAASRERADPEALARDLERLGPTYVKLGQLLSTRSDLIPDRYVEALSRLQDDVEPIPFSEVERVIETELGVRLHKLFPHFEEKPKASASLGQMHRARLRDGTDVAVKVQRPGVRERVIDDLSVIWEAADFLDQRTEIGRRYEFGRTVEEFRGNLSRELDYREEAKNLLILGENLAGFERIVVPKPHPDYSTTRVLTMDFIKGRKITSLSPLALQEVDGPALADEIFRAYLKQIVVDGFFHADPHPGNVLLTPDGKIALLDLGMVSRIPPDLQDDLLSMMLAIVDGRSDNVTELVVKIGTKREDYELEPIRRQIGELVLRHKDATLGEIDAGRVILEITRVSSGHGLRLPPEMTMLGKALLNLDQAVWTLDPDYDPNDTIREESANLMQRRIGHGFTEGNVFSGMLEVKRFAEALPMRVGKILDVVGDNKLRLEVDAFDEKRFIEGMQKIANRIALGILLGSMVVGAALMMRVETRFRLFEYPGLAIVFFLAAAAGAIALMVDILFSDERGPSKRAKRQL